MHVIKGGHPLEKLFMLSEQGVPRRRNRRTQVAAATDGFFCLPFRRTAAVVRLDDGKRVEAVGCDECVETISPLVLIELESVRPSQGIIEMGSMPFKGRPGAGLR